MSQPVIKYTLTKQGRQPEWLSSDSRAFKGQHSASANKAGKLPRFGAPQDIIYLGIGAGDPDSDGTPDGYVGTIASKADLQTYITDVGTAADYHVVTATVTGVQTSVTTGLSTAWNAINSEQGYQGGLSTTTSSKHTATGVGTVMVLCCKIYHPLSRYVFAVCGGVLFCDLVLFLSSSRNLVRIFSRPFSSSVLLSF